MIGVRKNFWTWSGTYFRGKRERVSDMAESPGRGEPVRVGEPLPGKLFHYIGSRANDFRRLVSKLGKCYATSWLPASGSIVSALKIALLKSGSIPEGPAEWRHNVL